MSPPTSNYDLSSTNCYNIQKTPPPSSYKIVPNKIIQHNVTSSNGLLTSSNPLLSSSSPLLTSSSPLLTSPPSQAAAGLLGLNSSPISSINCVGRSQEDRIKPIIDLVKKLVAGETSLIFSACFPFFSLLKLLYYSNSCRKKSTDKVEC